MSRAVTLENLIKKHGEEEGTELYNNYVSIQAYSGCSKEYFIDKYGIDLGLKKYKDLNKQKVLSLDNFIRKYGEEEGTKRFKDFYNKMGEKINSSKIADEFFENIFNKIKDNGFKKVYFSKLNKEFGKYNKDIKSYYYYDFVIADIKLCIEFNGDIYHARKSIYKENDIPKYRGNKTKTAKEIWEYDKIKIDFLKNKGYYVIIVWEGDYKNNKEKIIMETVEKILERKMIYEKRNT